MPILPRDWLVAVYHFRPALRGFFMRGRLESGEGAPSITEIRMQNDLSREAAAEFIRDAMEQAEEFRRMAAESRMRLLDIQCWIMEHRCIREHRRAMARIEAAEREKMLGPQL